MAQRKRRGFTIVELVIVIAVIVILAGVLIPTFISIINKANVSNDTALVKYLNTSLTSGSVLEAPTTMQAALDIVAEDGFDVAKIKAKASENEILWDSVNNCFVYLQGEEIVYVPDSKSVEATDVQLWKILEADEAISDKYSNYLAEGYQTKTITDLKTGIDVGKNTDISSITYKNATTTAQDVVFRTNGGTLSITDTNDASHQTHYGYVDSLEVATGNNCYVGHALVGEIVITQGKIVADKGAYIGIMKAMPADGTTITLEEKNEGVFTISSSATASNIDDSVCATLGYTKSSEGGTATLTPSEDRAEKSIYKIYSEDDLKKYRDLINNKKKVASAKLMNDISLTEDWIPIAEVDKDYYVEFQGTFDGNNKNISGMTISKQGYNYAGFFGRLGDNCVIKNLNLVGVNIVNVGNYCGGLAGMIQGSPCTIENCTVDATSTITSSGGYDTVGGLIGTIVVAGKDGAIIKNCTNYATVTNQTPISTEKKTYSRAGGIVGQVLGKNVKVTIENCQNYGKIQTNNGHAGGIVGSFQAQKGGVTLQELNVINCKNNFEQLGGNYTGNLFGWLAQDISESIISITLSDGETIDGKLIGQVSFSNGSISIDNVKYENVNNELSKVAE